jgi:hypothetical protein
MRTLPQFVLCELSRKFVQQPIRALHARMLEPTLPKIEVLHAQASTSHSFRREHASRQRSDLAL